MELLTDLLKGVFERFGEETGARLFAPASAGVGFNPTDPALHCPIKPADSATVLRVYNALFSCPKVLYSLPDQEAAAASRLLLDNHESMKKKCETLRAKWGQFSASSLALKLFNNAPPPPSQAVIYNHRLLMVGAAVDQLHSSLLLLFVGESIRTDASLARRVKEVARSGLFQVGVELGLAVFGDPVLSACRYSYLAFASLVSRCDEDIESERDAAIRSLLVCEAEVLKEPDVYGSASADDWHKLRGRCYANLAIVADCSGRHGEAIAYRNAAFESSRIAQMDDREADWLATIKE